MQKDEIDDELKNTAFDYFYWFSRFEFALKENGFLKSHDVGEKAEAGWEEFEGKCNAKYVPSEEAKQLVKLHPKRQIIAENGGLDWKLVGVGHCTNDLCKVILMLKAVRNNLFHGGKHGDREQDDKKRNLKLLSVGKKVLDQLADLGDFQGDYKRYY